MHAMTYADPAPVVVMTTVPPEFDFAALAGRLLEQRLAACVNVLPVMRSIYRWQGQIESADERQVLIKTRRDRLPALQAAIEAAHPYDVPEFLVLPVTGGSEAYLDWLSAEAAPPAGR